jgi:hypothetical protein
VRTPYIPHFFGAEAKARASGRAGWLTAGVVSSIPWPEDDVWLLYDGEEYFLHGVSMEGEKRNSPAISTPSSEAGTDSALSRLYRFTSILGFFKRGYVDITSTFSSGYIMRYSSSHDSFFTVTQAGKRRFDCNYMPIIEEDQVRRALAFLREGRRLRRVHEPYSFLSFFKVIESQLGSRDRVSWIEQSLDRLEGEAAKRVAELRADGVNVNDHLYTSGRCAIAHAGLGGEVVDPDIPSDRRRIASDIEIISALADHYIKGEAGVPDEMDLYRARDRVTPWQSLMTPVALASLKAGGQVDKPEDLGNLNGAKVTVRLWPDAPAEQFQGMTLIPQETMPGVVKFIALNSRKSIVLVFAMDVPNGRMHTVLNEGGIVTGVQTTQVDVEDYTRYFHSVLGNRTVELSIEGVDPVPCEIVIPCNIIPQDPEQAVVEAIAEFQRRQKRHSIVEIEASDQPQGIDGAT